MDRYISLAKEAVETYLKEGKIISPPTSLLPKMKKQTGVFVSIHRKDKSLRGCIGTFLPTTENIASEIIRSAIASATNDPRFLPVTKEELPDLTFSVDILSKLKLTPKPYTLSPKRYGLIVSTPDGRRGLLLPNLPDVKTPEEQFKICCLKGDINPTEKTTLQIFTVERHEEK